MSEGIFSLEINFLTLSGLFLPVVKEAPLAVCDYPAQTQVSLSLACSNVALSHFLLGFHLGFHLGFSLDFTFFPPVIASDTSRQTLPVLPHLVLITEHQYAE